MVAHATRSAAISADQPKTHAAPFALLAKLSSELCERLEEMESLKVGFAAALIHRLSRLHMTSPAAFTLTVQLMHDNERLLVSYREQGESQQRSKQAVHAEYQRELAAIEPVFPEVAAVIRATREQIRRHEEAGSERHTNGNGEVKTANRSAVLE